MAPADKHAPFIQQINWSDWSSVDVWGRVIQLWDMWGQCPAKYGESCVDCQNFCEGIPLRAIHPSLDPVGRLSAWVANARYAFYFSLFSLYQSDKLSDFMRMPILSTDIKTMISRLLGNGLISGLERKMWPSQTECWPHPSSTDPSHDRYKPALSRKNSSLVAKLLSSSSFYGLSTRCLDILFNWWQYTKYILFINHFFRVSGTFVTGLLSGNDQSRTCLFRYLHDRWYT